MPKQTNKTKRKVRILSKPDIVPVVIPDVEAEKRSRREERKKNSVNKPPLASRQTD